MKNIFYALFAVLLPGFISCDPPGADDGQVEVHFKALIKRQVKEGEKVFLTGNQENLGNWNPGIIAMHPEPNYMEKKLRFPKETNVEFKITKGSWDSEAVNADGSPPGNYSFKANQDTIIEITVSNWKDFNAPVQGQVTGEVVYYRKMEYPGIKARDVIVWLPPGYEESETARYPVLYAHDGQNVFDPATSFKGFDWRMDENADSLIRAKAVEPFIMIGIYNTADRSAEYGENELWETYADFLIQKLKPMVDSLYRTKPDPANTATVGSSMGGLISFRLAWEKNNVFGQAACLSPAFKYQNYDYVKYVKNYNGPKKNLELYLDNGTEDLEKILQPGADDMMHALNEKGYKFDWFLDQGAHHDEAAWAGRIWRPLVLFYGI